ncbi:MAG: EAL domain-containing protein [Firmicutes bacterium]|nr:EAL domain-containing protein [Bacillota bacterium]
MTSRSVRVVYQPILDMQSNNVLGYEALARGPNEEKAQDMFYEANRIGLSRELEIQCMQKALANAPEGVIFINIQPLTLLYLLNRLEPLPKAEHVVFELVETEEFPFDYKSEFVLSIKELQSRGYKFAIDDMASGFNRLELVQLLHPDYIKLDKPLTNGSFYSTVILKNVVNMAKALKIKTIAECIETPKQLNMVKSLGVEYGQGFLLGKCFSLTNF